MTDDERKAWLAERRNGIGASDAAAVCGLSPWQTAYGVYLDKLGQLPETPASAEMEFGDLFEAPIAMAYERRTGRQVWRPASRITRHPTLPHLFASLDYVTAGRVVQCKRSFDDDGWGEPGTDQVPEYYAIQVQHEMACAGLPVADIPVLIGYSDFRVYTVERDEAAIEALVTIETAFWDRVQRRDPPEPTWQHASTPKLVARLYGVDEGHTVTLGDEAMQLVEDYEHHGEIAGAAKDNKDRCKAQLLHMMGEAAVGFLPDGRTLTRKMVQRRAYEVAATEYVDFRVKKGRVKA